ncbi:MAG: PQQ-binding-like beta-propeller repeat protein [Actinobacteria bacterium]|nr:PQQ-binding-like beta-propeller repeat protein [Actinomycetota bacterium]
MAPRSACLALALTVLALSACGAGSTSTSPGGGGGLGDSGAGPAGSAPTSGTELTAWPEFGLDPQRHNATNRPTGITAADLGHLRRRTVKLSGTIDSSPIYLHAVVKGAEHAVIVVTSSYGRTFAIDADSGKPLWIFTPPGYAGWEGGAMITTTSPVADPGGRYVYAASPDGRVHKLSLATGREAGGAWPVSITRDPTREKMAAALNLDGPYVIAATGGYIGDAPVYQGHVVLISRGSGKVVAVYNSLCSNRHRIIVPRTCPQSASAVLSRGGAVVEPGGRRILFSTGNGNWNGKQNFGDSVIELTVPGLRRRQSFTPTNQSELDANDLDLGSSAPALLGGNRVLIAGKDGIMRVLDLARLDGHPPGGPARLGGEVQTLPTPGHDQLFTVPAVWHHGGKTTVFVADFSATAAYRLRGGRLHQLWETPTPGTSPIVAGGLVYVYEPEAGGIRVYSPSSSRPLAELPGSPGHWNSPIVVDGHIVEPEGDANDHSGSGTIDIFTAPEG